MSEEKLFQLGVLVGRFQTFHIGHEQMVRIAATMCNEVCVFIGSSQEFGTNKNPYSYELRAEVLRRIFPDERIKIYPLPDTGSGNSSLWGDYVLENVKDRFGKYPDLLITGKEERRTGWFASETGQSITEIFVPKTIRISASEMRQFLIDDDAVNWKRYSNPAIWDMYPTLRDCVLKSKDVMDTQSC